ncbi:hypothetical protein DEO72_LG6g1115 [Vigna unguiculata]|uniref:Uncharacterized protein n=1 Tax=Vigna unguiculata TaxID=3917 RepID=A0A4D6M6K3_VIGUN|nr:hypothetical protein DEO72_LG6g1115 [Vigna unguiculata]
MVDLTVVIVHPLVPLDACVRCPCSKLHLLINSCKCNLTFVILRRDILGHVGLTRWLMFNLSFLEISGGKHCILTRGGVALNVGDDERWPIVRGLGTMLFKSTWWN